MRTQRPSPLSALRGPDGCHSLEDRQLVAGGEVVGVDTVGTGLGDERHAPVGAQDEAAAARQHGRHFGAALQGPGQPQRFRNLEVVPRRRPRRLLQKREGRRRVAPLDVHEAKQVAELPAPLVGTTKHVELLQDGLVGEITAAPATDAPVVGRLGVVRIRGERGHPGARPLPRHGRGREGTGRGCSGCRPC